MVTVRSIGQQTDDNPIERIWIQGLLVEEGQFAAEPKALVPMPCLFAPVILLEDPQDIVVLEDFLNGFLLGQGDGVQGFVGDVAAGVFIWGDLRDCGIQAINGLRPDREVDWTVFGFAAAGLALEFAPGLGEPVDVVLAAVKSAMKKLPAGPARRVMAGIPSRMVEIARVDGWSAVAQYADDTWEFMKYLFEDLTPTELQRWVNVLTSSRKFDLALRIFRESCEPGKSAGKSSACMAFFENVLETYSDDVAEKFLAVFSDFDRPTMQLVRNSDEAVRGLAELVKQSPAGMRNIREALTNPDVFGNTHFYTQDAFLTDCGRLFDGGLGRQDGLGSILKDLAGSNDPVGVRGKLFEVFSAREILDQGDEIASVGLKRLDHMGIDISTSTTTYQAKISVNALWDEIDIGDYEALEDALMSKRSAITKTLGEGTPWKLLLPDSQKVLAEQQPQLMGVLDRVGLTPIRSVGELP